jgi:hypothetical protein
MTKAKAQNKPLPSYRVLVGANFPDGKKGSTGERRINVGDVVDDLPQHVAEYLLKHGAIEEVK